MRTESHPIGFRKYVLLSMFGVRLRLHVWRDGGVDSRHNHRWWFVSVPLIGRFVETRYQEAAGNDMLKIAVLDEAGRRDSGRVYRKSGLSSLDSEKTRIRYPLIPYYCPIDAIHSLVPMSGGLHASLVLIGRLQKDSSDIWRHADKLDVPLDSADDHQP